MKHSTSWRCIFITSWIDVIYAIGLNIDLINWRLTGDKPPYIIQAEGKARKKLAMMCKLAGTTPEASETLDHEAVRPSWEYFYEAALFMRRKNSTRNMQMSCPYQLHHYVYRRHNRSIREWCVCSNCAYCVPQLDCGLQQDESIGTGLTLTMISEDYPLGTQTHVYTDVSDTIKHQQRWGKW